MNLHQLVRGAISSINPDQPITIKKFTGYDNSGVYAIPTYESFETTAQIQPIRSSDIQHINNFNTSSVYKNMYLNGDWNGLNRAIGSGGDLVIWNNQTWYIVAVDENFSPTAGWTKITVCLQIDEGVTDDAA